jgi:hypothetical protein
MAKRYESRVVTLALHAQLHFMSQVPKKKKHLPDKYCWLRATSQDPKQAGELVKAAVDGWGKLNIRLSNAGIFKLAAILE